MNSFLLWLGITVAVLLTAALAVPFFIDWSSQRDFFEARASAILGRPVTFAGPLEVRLVPFPSLEARDVRIGGDEGEGAEAISIRAALAPLLSGELHISEMTLTRPRTVVRIAEDGSVHWAEGGGTGDLPLSPERTAVDEFEILDGEITLDDARTGARYLGSGLNLVGSAGTLAGPFRVEGGGFIDGTRYTVRLATGRVQADGALRMTASISPADRPLTVGLDGALQIGGESLVYTGGIDIARPQIEGMATMPWRLTGSVQANSSEAIFDRLSLRLGPEAGGILLSGAANVGFDDAPRFEAVLSARQVDLDRTLGGGPEQPISPSQALSRLGGLLDPSVFPIPGHVSLDVASVVVSENLIEEVAADLEVQPGHWRIERVQARAPGRTGVGLSGGIDFSGGAPAFDGALRISGEQAGVLAAWLFGPDTRVPGIGAVTGTIEAGARIGLDRGGMRLDNLDVETGGARLAGSLAYTAATDGARGRLEADLRTDRFEIDIGELSGQRPASALAGMLAPLDLDIAFEAGMLAVPPVDIGDVAVTLSADRDEVRVDRLSIGDLGGARLTGQGSVSGLEATPEGRFIGSLEANSMAALAELMTTVGLRRPGAALAARAEALAPADLDLTLDAGRVTAGDSYGVLALTGQAGGSTLDLSLGLRGALARLAEADVTFELAAGNPDGGRLAEQLRLPTAAAADGPGELTVTARGHPRFGMPAHFEMTGLGLDGSLDGRVRLPGDGYEVSGTLAATMADPAAVLGGLGVTLPDDPQTPVTLSAELSAVDEVWRLSDLSISSGEMRADGTLAFDLGGPGERAVDGSLDVSSVDLPWLLAVMLGPEAMTGLSATLNFGETVWPSVPFAPLHLGEWRGRIGVTTPRLELGGPFTVSEAGFRVDVDPTRFAVDRIRGRLLGGEASGALELATSAGGVRLDTRFDLANARLDEIAWRDAGRPVATGTLSAGFEVAGSGRSLAGLVATLSGNGSIRVEDGVIRRLNPRAFDMIVRAADAGLELKENEVARVFAGHLDAGSLAFERGEGSLSIDSGVVRARNVRIDTRALHSFASATVDLTVMGLDSEWSISTGAEESGRTREVGLVFAGPITDPARQVDVNPLLGYLTVRAFEQEVERLERLQSDIMERERLGRELIRLGQERRKREQMIEAAARRAEEERRAQEEERRQAEEEARRAGEEREPEPSDGPAQSQERSPAPDGSPDTEGLDEERFRRMIDDILRSIPAVGEPLAPPAEGVPASPPAEGDRAPDPASAPIDITPPAINGAARSQPVPLPPEPAPRPTRDPSLPVY